MGCWPQGRPGVHETQRMPLKSYPTPRMTVAYQILERLESIISRRIENTFRNTASSPYLQSAARMEQGESEMKPSLPFKFELSRRHASLASRDEVSVGDRGLRRTFIIYSEAYSRIRAEFQTPRHQRLYYRDSIDISLKIGICIDLDLQDVFLGT